MRGITSEVIIAKRTQKKKIRRANARHCYVLDRSIPQGEEAHAGPGMRICPNCIIGLIKRGMEHV